MKMDKFANEPEIINPYYINKKKIYIYGSTLSIRSRW